MGESRIQYRFIGLRKAGIPVEIDEDREVGADIETAEGNDAFSNESLWLFQHEGDALDASCNGCTLNEVE